MYLKLKMSTLRVGNGNVDVLENTPSMDERSS